MALIGSLVSFTAGNKIVAADVNANFSAIRSAFNTSAVLTDTPTTITATQTFTVSQRFGADVVLTASASRLVPGATSFAVRNTANTADNVLITDAGVVTIRAQLVAGAAGQASFVNADGMSLDGGAGQYGLIMRPTVSILATSIAVAGLFRVATAAVVFTAGQVVGVDIQDAVKGSGSTITTQYGLKIEDQTQGSSKWAIYTGLGLVRFGDNVTCAAALNVAGTMTVSTALSAPTLVVTTAGTVGAVALGINNDPTSGFYIASGGVQVAASGTNVSDMRASLWQAAVKARAVAGFIVGNGATLATSATIGYIYVPTTPGTATGVPTIGTVETGTVALAFDTTNNRLQIYNSGWKTVALT